MRNNKLKIKIFGGIIICALTVYIAATLWPGAEPADGVEAVVYFFNPASNNLEGEKRFIPTDEYGTMAMSVINVISEGPKNKNLIKTFPDSIKFADMWIQGRLIDNTTLEADFTIEYKNMTATQELFFRAAFVWSMTGLGFIHQVHFYVDGQELLNSFGLPVGLMSRENLVINPEIQPGKTESQLVKLYFCDKEYKQLIEEERYIMVNPDQPIEKYIVEQLIAGPQREGSYAAIPPETKIRGDVKTDKGICYVNLSTDFITKHSGGAALERLTVYSIVNSLTALPHITKVQFLIESERVVDFKGNIDLSKLFERDESLIRQQ